LVEKGIESKGACQTRRNCPKKEAALKSVVAVGKNVELISFDQDLIRAPTVPVALLNKLKSSRRTFQPNASSITNCIHSWRDNQQLWAPVHHGDAKNK
jgi:hypothetical protein